MPNTSLTVSPMIDSSNARVSPSPLTHTSSVTSKKVAIRAPLDTLTKEDLPFTQPKIHPILFMGRDMQGIVVHSGCSFHRLPKAHGSPTTLADGGMDLASVVVPLGKLSKFSLSSSFYVFVMELLKDRVHHCGILVIFEPRISGLHMQWVTLILCGGQRTRLVVIHHAFPIFDALEPPWPLVIFLSLASMVSNSHGRLRMTITQMTLYGLTNLIVSFLLPRPIIWGVGHLGPYGFSYGPIFGSGGDLNVYELFFGWLVIAAFSLTQSVKDRA
ncbi:hypothetical protein Ancab_023316 [Ancistrocladus abbreviatus]